MFLFNKKNSLKNKKDIENLFKNGKTCSHRFLRTIYLPSESFLKIGVSIPKKLIPLAVKRNLIKRRIKEQIRLFPKGLLEKKDGFLFILFHGKKEVSSKEIYECLKILFSKTFH